MATKPLISTTSALAALAIALTPVATATTAAAAPERSDAVGRTLLAQTSSDAGSVRTVNAAPLAKGDTRPYSWPLKPFNRQHSVRGFFNDPREGEHGGLAFHFGVDIAAPDGTPVYAVEAGTVHIDNGRAVAVVAPDGSHSFGYWHIVPAVKHLQRVHKHQLLGYIAHGFEHVHFAESRERHYVNPLRPGALTPYVDHVAPTVAAISVWHEGSRVAIVADAFDMPSPAVPGAWGGKPVTPVLLQWRVRATGGHAPAWRTAVDFRKQMLDRSLYHSVYADGTHQNHEESVGRYLFNVSRAWNVRSLADGTYRIDVRASDTASNTATLSLTVDVADGAIVH